MIELRQLRYFIVLAEEENFRRASARLHIDQSAVSRQIQDLELQLGFGLFQRTSRGIRLSEAGTAYLEYAREVFSTIDQAKEAGEKASRARSAVLSLGINEIALHYPVVTTALQRFQQNHPEVEIELSLLTLPQQRTAYEMQTLDGGFLMETRANLPDPSQDLGASAHDADEAHAFPPDAANENDFHQLHILTDELAVFVPTGHPLAARESIALSDLSQETLIRLPWSSTGRLDRMMRARHFRTLRLLEMPTVDAIFSLVEAKIGVALLVASLRNIARSGVVHRPITDSPGTATLSLAWPRRPPTSAFQSFLQILQSAMESSAKSRDPAGGSVR